MPRSKARRPFTSPLAIAFNKAADTSQPSSAFFRLPPEIRNIIYDMVFKADQPLIIDPQALLRVKRNLSLSLLQTCRQAYIEAHLSPIYTNQQYECIIPCRPMAFDSFPSPRPDRNPLEQMVPWQKSTITEFHIAMQLCHTCFMRGVYLKALLAGTGMAQTLRTIHLYWVAEQLPHRRERCERASYWRRRHQNNQTRATSWDLRNFALLKEITIQFEVGTAINGSINLTTQVDLAKTWSFRVGGGRVLNLDATTPECNNLVSFPGSSANALRWVETGQSSVGVC